MRLLLDTHAFLWFAEGNARLSARASALITDPQNDKLVSMASAYEMAVKISIGKLMLAEPCAAFIRRVVQQNSFTLLPITLDHVSGLSTLPVHHRDPFDRLLAAQAQVEQVPIVSVDPILDAYGITRLW